MPIYEWICECGHTEEVVCPVSCRDAFRPEHHDGKDHRMFRNKVGGVPLLYFEEGRARTHIALSDRPITSKKQHEILKKLNGVVESGDTVPPSVASNPKSVGMKRFISDNKKKNWV